MKKISILAIAPYEGMAELLNSIAREREDIDMTVRVGNLKDGVKIVQELTEDFTYDAVISRGGTAEMIRSVCDVAVTDIMAENTPSPAFGTLPPARKSSVTFCSIKSISLPLPTNPKCFQPS